MTAHAVGSVIKIHVEPYFIEVLTRFVDSAVRYWKVRAVRVALVVLVL